MAGRREVVFCDVECFENYFLISFRHHKSGRIIELEMFDGQKLDRMTLRHLLSKYTIVTFNGNNYDVVIIEAAMAGFNNLSLKKMTNDIISDGMRPWQIRKQYGFPGIEMDHIDLIEVAPLKASLKIYAGRVDCPVMQDIPFDPHQPIDLDSRKLVSNYCRHDTYDTQLLYETLHNQIELRYKMSKEYGVDLRSKSDAQVAEEVIKAELKKKTGKTVRRPKIPSGTKFYYKPPKNLVFKTDVMKKVLEEYTTRPFEINKAGYVNFTFPWEESDRLKSGKNKGQFPDKPKTKKVIQLGYSKYTIGIGGIHSNEKSISHISDDEWVIRDYDVASYYPRIILNNKLFPKHIGKIFLEIYKSIVKRRLEAKRRGDKDVDASLKITINGSFGKYGSKWSILYSPDLMAHVTITGQLTLLMLVERLELAGVSVVSGNTDGIVIKMRKDQVEMVEDIVFQWEVDTDYDLEHTNYKMLCSRDINNYIAVKEKGCKGKGAYADQKEPYYILRNNPVNRICVEAVKNLLIDGKPIENTIHECDDVRKFTSIRTVNGGAIKDDEVIGKAIRWYYGANELDIIRYSTSGKKVPRTDGAVPLMELPDTLPDDIDYQWYIEESKSMLKQIGLK